MRVGLQAGTGDAGELDVAAVEPGVDLVEGSAHRRGEGMAAGSADDVRSGDHVLPFQIAKDAVDVAVVAPGAFEDGAALGCAPAWLRSSGLRTAEGFLKVGAIPDDVSRRVVGCGRPVGGYVCPSHGAVRRRAAAVVEAGESCAAGSG